MFGSGAAEKIVNELLQMRVLNEQGKTVSVTGEFVEPVQLQVVCQTLWDDLPQGLEVIDEGRLGDFGDIGQALGRFYDSVLEQASGESQNRQRQLRSWIDRKLITPGGTRGMVNEKDELTAAITPESLELLVSKHLVRAERRHGSRWFELAHDRFLPPIQASNLRFLGAFEARRESMARIAGLSGIVYNTAAGYLILNGNNSSWVFIVFLLMAGVSAGITAGIVVYVIREGRNPIPNWRWGLGALALLASIVYLVVGAILSHSWWQLSIYASLVVIYISLIPAWGASFVPESTRTMASGV